MITRNPYNRPIPDYYDTMYMDGYEPWKILAAAHKKMLAAVAKPQEDYTINVKSTVEVKQ